MLLKSSVLRLVLGMMFLSPFAMAMSGVEEGEKICQNMTFANDKMKCMTEIHRGRFYQSQALQICKNFTFVREQLECIEKVRNKSYTDTLLATCRDMTFSSKIMECLAQFGNQESELIPAPIVVAQPHYPRLPAPFPVSIEFGEQKRVRKMIKKAMKQMDRGNYYAARQTLEEAFRLAE